MRLVQHSILHTSRQLRKPTGAWLHKQEILPLQADEKGVKATDDPKERYFLPEMYAKDKPRPHYKQRRPYWTAATAHV